MLSEAGKLQGQQEEAPPDLAKSVLPHFGETPFELRALEVALDVVGPSPIYGSCSLSSGLEECYKADLQNSARASVALFRQNR